MTELLSLLNNLSGLQTLCILQLLQMHTAACVFLLQFYAYVWFGMVGRPTEENLRSSTQKETFDGSRKDINAAINQVCEFTGEHLGAFGYDPHFVECSLICCFLFLQELK